MVSQTRSLGLPATGVLPATDTSVKQPVVVALTISNLTLFSQVDGVVARGVGLAKAGAACATARAEAAETNMRILRKLGRVKATLGAFPEIRNSGS